MEKYKEIAEKCEHKNTMKISSKEVEVKVPLKPEIFGVEGMFFSNSLTLHLQSHDSDGQDLKYFISIKRESLLNGSPIGEVIMENCELNPDTTIDISSFPEGNYILTAKAYKTLPSGEDILPVYSDAAEANFSIVKKDAIHNAICYEDGIAHLKRKGLLNSDNDRFNNYINGLLDIESFKEGLFLAVKTPKLSTKQYHETTVTILGKEFNVVYEKTKTGGLKKGIKKGLLYIPKEEIPEATADTNIIIKTSEYADNRKELLLDEFIEEGTIFELGGFFVNYDKNSTSVFMSDPKPNQTFMNINLIFNNINLASLTCGYEIVHNGESRGLKIMKGSSANILLNAAGDYVVKAYTFVSSDTDFENPISTYEKNYSLIDPEYGFEIDCPVNVMRGGTLKFDILTKNEDAKFKVSLKKYIDRIDGEKIPGGYRYELPIPKSLPVGLHVLFCEEEQPGKDPRVISKQFEVVKDEDSLDIFNLPHYKKIIREGTSFVFSGHNIKYFSILAMESFSKRCKVNKKQIIYFDDFSTDGTKEELEKRGFSVITWDKEIYDKFSRSEFNENLEVRIDQIILSVTKTVHSRYICFIDGDTFCHKNILDLILNHIFLKDMSSKQFDVFGFVKSSYSKDDLALSNLGCSVYHNFLWFDREAITNDNLLSSNIEDISAVKTQAGEVLFNNLYSSGNNLYYNLQKGDSRIILKDLAFQGEEKWKEDFENCITHIGKVSSSIRDLDNFKSDWGTQLTNVQSLLDLPEVISFTESLGLDINDIKLEYYSKVMGDI